MYVSQKLKDQRVASLIVLVETWLSPDETIRAVTKCNNMKPTVDRLVVTSRRLLAISSMQKQIRWESELTNITTAEVVSKDRFSVSTAGGVAQTFKMVPPDDVAVLLDHIRAGRTGSDAPVVEPHDAGSTDDESLQQLLLAERTKRDQANTEAQEKAERRAEVDSERAERAATKAAERSAAKEEKQLIRVQRAQAHDAAIAAKAKAGFERNQAKEQAKADDLERYGRLFKKDNIGFKTVAIYDKGYVQVGVGATTYERLLGIHFSRTVQDKSSGGRAVGALATGGINLLTSKERRDVFLTITTDVKVHQLKAEGRIYERTCLALEGAGLAVIEKNKIAERAAPAPTPAPNRSRSLADELAKLASLKESGALSDDEFAAAKSRLLSQ